MVVKIPWPPTWQPNITLWALVQKNVLKVPVGVPHVVLDTPGGIHGFELAKVVMSAHAILVSVCHSRCLTANPPLSAFVS